MWSGWGVVTTVGDLVVSNIGIETACYLSMMWFVCIKTKSCLCLINKTMNMMTYDNERIKESGTYMD